MNRAFFDRRVELGLTLEALVAKAGVADKTVQRAEHGQPIQAIKAARLAKALDRNVAELFRFKGAMALPLDPEPSEVGA